MGEVLPLTNTQWTERLEKLRPHLRQGKSLYRACVDASVPHSSTMEKFNTDKDWAERVEREMNYVAGLYYQGMYSRILIISNKVQKQTEISNQFIDKKITEEEFHKQMEKWKLTISEDIFWKWLSEHHPSVKNEFAARSEVTGKDGADLLPKELLQPKALETALKTLEYIIKKEQQTVK